MNTEHHEHREERSDQKHTPLTARTLGRHRDALSPALRRIIRNMPMWNTIVVEPKSITVVEITHPERIVEIPLARAVPERGAGVVEVWLITFLLCGTELCLEGDVLSVCCIESAFQLLDC